MWVEWRDSNTNVLRFPIERRAWPTLDLMRTLAPDVHEVLATAMAAGLDPVSLEVRAQADAATAEHIHGDLADSVDTANGAGGRDALDALLGPVIVAAIAASWSARDMSSAAAGAHQALARARTTGEGWLAPLRQQAAALQLAAARLVIEAHARTEYAEGVAHAVDCARRGESWLPNTEGVGVAAALAGTTGQPGFKAVPRPLGSPRRRRAADVAEQPPCA